MSKNEDILISHMISNLKARESALMRLRASDFQDSRNKAAFHCISLLYSTGREVTPETIYLEWDNYEKGKASMDHLYGISFLSTSALSDVEPFINAIKRRSQCEQLFSLYKIAAEDTIKNEEDPEILAKKIQDSVDLIFNLRSGTDLTLEEMLSNEYRDSGQDYLGYIENLMKNPRKSGCTGLTTGIYELDIAIDGLNKGHYIAIGARPGVGKTTFCLNIINHMIRNNVPTGMFSLEMSHEDILNNLACIHTGVPSKLARRGFLTPDQFNRLKEFKEEFKNAPFYIDTDVPLTVEQLYARTRRWVNKYGIKLLVIDYLGEVKASGKYPNKQEEMQHVSKAIRALAKNLKIPIICIVQLNRELEKSVSRPPIKSDIRESGQIEADAHCILLLHRPETEKRDEEIVKAAGKASKYENAERFTGGYNSRLNDERAHPKPKNVQDFEKNKRGNLQIHIVKNRFGSECVLDTYFKKETGQILPVDKSAEHPDEPYG
jgi:replicative DNA helicase